MIIHDGQTQIATHDVINWKACPAELTFPKDFSDGQYLQIKIEAILLHEHKGTGSHVIVYVHVNLPLT